jgi:hypothetical protein
VPQSHRVGSLTVTAEFDSGPLAGILHATTIVPLGK